MTTKTPTPVAVEFLTRDQTVLRGQSWISTNSWVVLIHPPDKDLDVWSVVPAAAVEAGFSVLTFDLRGLGASDGSFDRRLAVEDVVDALRYIADRNGQVISVVGAELGGTLAIAAAEPGLVTGCVALSPLPTLDGADASAQTVSGRVPTLIVVGSEDEDGDKWATELHQACNSWCSCMRVPVADRGAALLTGEWSQDVLESMIKYFRYLEWMAEAGDDQHETEPE